MRQLVEDLQTLEERLRQGGGAKKIEKQHRDGKLTARERIAQLIDPGAMFLEIGLLIAHDRYDGQAPAAVEELGYREPVPLDVALERTIAWERQNQPAQVDPKQFDYAAEDAALGSPQLSL